MKTKSGIVRISFLFLICTVLIAAGAQPALSIAKAQGDTGRLTPDITTGYTNGSTPPALAAVTEPYYPAAPAYDSHWQAVDAGAALTLTHNLGGSVDNYVVDLRFSSEDTPLVSLGYNQMAYGGNQLVDPVPSGFTADDMVGAYWHSLTTSTVKVYRMPQDKSYALKVRLRIWVVANSDWDSGWYTMNPGIPYSPSFIITGGAVDNYLVYMEFKDTNTYPIGKSGYGIHQRYYGGLSLADADKRVGAYWRNLTATSVTAYVREDETFIGKVRLRIWNRPNSTYDSGWVDTGPGHDVYLGHIIGGNPDDYMVDLQFKDTAVWGVNQRCYGSCDLRSKDGSYANTKQGAYWRKLTNTQIEVGRRAGDISAVQVRVRIWNIWTPSTPDYDSDWTTTAAGAATSKAHNLGGSPDDYYLNLQFYQNSYQTTQLYYGSKCFGDTPPSGYAANDMGGAYWRSLTDTSVVVYRGAQDKSVEKWRLQIWKMPKPDYDSGWTVIDPGSAHTFHHGLTGNNSDFLVDVTFYDPSSGSGVNQRFFGGMVTGTNQYYGAQWHSFTTAPGDENLSVYRYPNDIVADQVRVRIWRVNAPSYQSGYVAYGPGENNFMTHNLQAPSERLLVDATAQQASGDHKNFYGRVDIGTGSPFPGMAENDQAGFMWYRLSKTSIEMFRLPDDATASSINLRIWVLPTKIYLPSIRK